MTNSINSRLYLKFCGFFAFLQKAQNDKIRRHCEQILQKFAWQSINLKANLPLDCHEFARLRFANSRNDKTLVILTCLAIPNTLCIVILSAAKYP